MSEDTQERLVITRLQTKTTHSKLMNLNIGCCVCLFYAVEMMIKNMNKLVLSLVAACVSSVGFGSPLHPQSGTLIKVKAPYTMGTHDLESTEMQGEVDFDAQKSMIRSGVLRVPIMSLKHEDKELQCHLRESLGLDNEKSDFPDEHVCDDDDLLPEEGKNAIVFPEITAQVSDPMPIGPAELPVTWTIHGITRQMPTQVTST